MIAIGLNAILGLLLVCALIMGMRLDRRLRGLRGSHAEFAKAVQELDQAALRTEASLAELRAGTDAARTELAARIDQARLLTQRLDKLTAEAAKALEAPLQLSQPMPQHPSQLLSRPIARLASKLAALPPAASTMERRAQSQPEAAASPRSRVLVDDDLFEIGAERRAPLAAAMGGRR